MRHSVETLHSRSLPLHKLFWTIENDSHCYKVKYQPNPDIEATAYVENVASIYPLPASISGIVLVQAYFDGRRT